MAHYCYERHTQTDVKPNTHTQARQVQTHLSAARQTHILKYLKLLTLISSCGVHSDINVSFNGKKKNILLYIRDVTIPKPHTGIIPQYKLHTIFTNKKSLLLINPTSTTFQVLCICFSIHKVFLVNFKINVDKDNNIR